MPYAIRVYEYWLRSYRRVWKGSVVTTALNPVLYLTALGIGLGKLVNKNGSGLGVPFLDYVAPGILASTAMLVAAFESSYPVMAAIRWTRQFHAQLATPIRVRDTIVGHQLYVCTRVATAAFLYLIVMAGFGTIHSWLAVFAFPAAILLGLSFSLPVSAMGAWLERDEGFNALFRFGITPMFLFSGTFFPVTRLPHGFRELAYVTPTWHGVVLMRSLTLGNATLWWSLAHAGYLAAWAALGYLLALRTFQKRLVT